MTELQRLEKLVAKASKAHAALPREGLDLDGWRVIPEPGAVFPRARVLLVKPDASAYAPVWADRWKDALAAAKRGESVPDDCRAPAVEWAADDGAGS